MEEKSLRPYNGEFSTVTYTYKDTVVDKLIWKHAGKMELHEYHYDSLNRCTLETHDGKAFAKTKYDVRGNAIEYFIYRDEPYRTNHITLTYDDQNRKMETNYYHEDSLMDTRYLYSYTDSGYSYIIYRSDETVLHVYVRNDYYNCDYFYYDSISPSTLRSKNEYWRNSNGLTQQIKEELNTRQGEHHATQTGVFVGFTYYQYEYDLMGNWIKKVATGVSNYTGRRVIEYYEP